MKPKIIYFGTPALAVAPLRALVESGKYEILAVVTQPDKPAGRGKEISASPVKAYAAQVGIKVFQPDSLKQITRQDLLQGDAKNKEFVAFLNDHSGVDLFVVVAYGKIIPKALIDVPKKGILNIHLSLLPRWRGAAPVQRAILHGDKESGVSIMKIDEGLDTGPIFISESVNISESDDSGTLSEKLVRQGTRLLLENLPAILAGTLRPYSQDDTGATYAEKLLKEDFRIKWKSSAAEIIYCVRAARPSPGAFADWENIPVKVFAVSPHRNENFPPSEAGTIVEATKASMVVAVGKGEFLSLDELQFPSKKRLPIQEILKGKSFAVGSQFR